MGLRPGQDTGSGGWGSPAGPGVSWGQRLGFLQKSQSPSARGGFKESSIPHESGVPLHMPAKDVVGGSGAGGGLEPGREQEAAEVDRCPHGLQACLCSSDAHTAFLDTCSAPSAALALGKERKVRGGVPGAPQGWTVDAVVPHRRHKATPEYTHVGWSGTWQEDREFADRGQESPGQGFGPKFVLVSHLKAVRCRDGCHRGMVRPGGAGVLGSARAPLSHLETGRELGVPWHVRFPQAWLF